MNIIHIILQGFTILGRVIHRIVKLGELQFLTSNRYDETYFLGSVLLGYLWLYNILLHALRCIM
jgi:hypothetical protein